MAARLMTLVRRLVHDQRGSVVIDFIPAFFAVMIIVLTIFEIGIAYYLTLGAHKAAQLGARLAVTLPPVHSSVPARNTLAFQNGQLGDPCTTPGFASACLDPGGPWECNGALLSGQCDNATFQRVVSEMRRTYPRLTSDSVSIAYIDRGLGEAGGPFVPEIQVSIDQHSYQFVTLTLGTLMGALQESGPSTLSRITASAFGENLGTGG